MLSDVEPLIREVLPRAMAGRSLALEDSLNADLAIDSLGLMSLAFRVEETFGIDVMAHADRIATVETVGDLVAFVRDLGKASEAGTGP